MVDKPKKAGTSSGKDADYRRADTGQYTSPKYAKDHPRTTIKETRKK